MIKKIIFSNIMLLLFLSNGCAQNSIEFHLSDSMIDTVNYALSFDSTYSIFIKLKEPYTREFQKLTGNNLGKMLEVYKDSEVIIEATIKTEIPNGLMSINNIKTKDELNNYLKLFKNKLSK